jgi:hypothetical protein
VVRWIFAQRLAGRSVARDTADETFANRIAPTVAAFRELWHGPVILKSRAAVVRRAAAIRSGRCPICRAIRWALRSPKSRLKLPLGRSTGHRLRTRCSRSRRAKARHAPVEADHGEVIGHEIACPVLRRDHRSVGPDPGREVSVPGVRRHPACSRPIATSTTAQWSAKYERSAASATEATGACPGVVISASLWHERKTTRMTDVPGPAAGKTGQQRKERP